MWRWAHIRKEWMTDENEASDLTGTVPVKLCGWIAPGWSRTWQLISSPMTCNITAKHPEKMSWYSKRRCLNTGTDLFQQCFPNLLGLTMPWFCCCPESHRMKKGLIIWGCGMWLYHWCILPWFQVLRNQCWTGKDVNRRAPQTWQNDVQHTEQSLCYSVYCVMIMLPSSFVGVPPDTYCAGQFVN